MRGQGRNGSGCRMRGAGSGNPSGQIHRDRSRCSCSEVLPSDPDSTSSTADHESGRRYILMREEQLSDWKQPGHRRRQKDQAFLPGSRLPFSKYKTGEDSEKHWDSQHDTVPRSRGKTPESAVWTCRARDARNIRRKDPPGRPSSGIRCVRSVLHKRAWFLRQA